MILLLLMVACGGTQPERRPGAGSMACPHGTTVATRRQTCPRLEQRVGNQVFTTVTPGTHPDCSGAGVGVCGVHLTPGWEGRICVCERTPDVAEGPIEEVDGNGQTTTRGQCSAEQAEGGWRHYVRGRVSVVARYRKGLLHGVWQSLWPNGQKRIEGVYNSGLKQGVWRSWSVDGTEQPSDLYVDDVLQTQPKERED